MKEKYIHPQLIIIDLDATSVSCVTTTDHVYDDEEFGTMGSAETQRDRIRISTPNDMEIGGGRQSIF